MSESLMQASQRDRFPGPAKTDPEVPSHAVFEQFENKGLHECQRYDD